MTHPLDVYDAEMQSMATELREARAAVRRAQEKVNDILDDMLEARITYLESHSPAMKGKKK